MRQEKVLQVRNLLEGSQSIDDPVEVMLLGLSVLDSLVEVDCTVFIHFIVGFKGLNGVLLLLELPEDGSESGLFDVVEDRDALDIRTLLLDPLEQMVE